MSTALVIQEIQSFLASGRPEVLCIRGKWGVGKTFAWRRYLEEANKQGRLKEQDYAYVSLFGLNSLDDLRYAIFESTVPPDKALSGPNAETFGVLVDKGLSIGRKARTWLGPALSAVGFGEVGNAVARSAFLLVRNQLICIDDMERAGDELKPRDVLGMISFLKEQRNCRVAILLNDEAMQGEDQADFRRLLEKVVDVSLTFAPTPSEAAAIAISDDVPVGVQLRDNVTALGITNIRVIKKIERLALRLAESLKPFRPEVLSQAVVACVLGGWVAFEPDHAPSLDFIREYNALVIAMRERDNDPMPDVLRWRDKFEVLRFSHSDDFEKVIFDGAQVGFFDQEMLLAEAKTIEEALNRDHKDNSFIQAWRLYRGSLAIDDNALLDAIYNGACANLAEINTSDINATITLLRENGRDEQAEALVPAYIAAQTDNPRFFDLGNHIFMADNPLDPALRVALEDKRATYVDERDPAALLVEIMNGGEWNEEDMLLLSSLSPDAFQTIFESAEGENLRRIIQQALRMSQHNEDNAVAMRASVQEALTRIANRSPLRARRLRGWGFRPDLE
jgi:hypothetical protein